MNKREKLQVIEKLLCKRGWDAETAKELARDAIEKGEPVLESICFQMLAEYMLASIHSASWVKFRGSEPNSDGHEVIKRLLQSGASAEDLAIFARILQREYLSNLGCILDGSIFGTPDLPCKDFRVFSVDELGKPQAELEELHEPLAWTDLETEMRLSREAEEEYDRQAGANDVDDE